MSSRDEPITLTKQLGSIGANSQITDNLTEGKIGHYRPYDEILIENNNPNYDIRVRINQSPENKFRINANTGKTYDTTLINSLIVENLGSGAISNGDIILYLTNKKVTPTRVTQRLFGWLK